MSFKLSYQSLYWMGYILIVFSDMFINVKYINRITDSITLLGILMIAVYIVCGKKKYQLNVMILFAIIGFVLLISYGIYSDFTPLRFILLLIASAGMDFEQIVKKDFKIKLFFLILVIILSFMGMCNNTQFIRGEQIRYTLGFIHPNTTGFYGMMLTMEYIFIYRNELKMHHLIIIACSAFLIFVVTSSRGSVIGLLFLGLGLIVKKMKGSNYYIPQMGKHFFQNVFLVMTVITLVLTWGYTSSLSWAVKINEIFSSRLYYFSYYLKNYSVNIMGNKLSAFYGALDNAYLMLLLEYGMVSYFLYSLLYYKKIKELFKKEDYVFIMILTVLSAYGIMEKSIIMAAYNVFLVSFSTVFFGNGASVKRRTYGICD